ncbi:MAG: two-component regulator propeller domain-containing protein [Melioribacteraceae bacterium]
MNKILLMFFFISISTFSQTIKSWQNYSSFKNVAQSCQIENTIWAATDGGIFGFSASDSSYQILTKSDGLISQNITSISKDQNNKLWIGTNEGYIIVYTPETGELKTILEIFKTDKSIKTINNILISDDTAFVSTAFGLTLININDFSFFDSILKFGEFTTETPVKKVYLGSTIFVITQAGIAYKKSGATNLTAPESWLNINISTQIPATSINSLIEFENEIYAATDKGLLKNSNGIWSSFLYNNFEVLDVIEKNQMIYSLLENTIHLYNGSDQIIISEQNINFNSFIVDTQNNLYISTNKGLFFQSESKQNFLMPNSPATNGFINITVDHENNFWSATGKNGAGIGVIKFDNSNWSILNTSNTNEMIFNDFHRVSASGKSVYFSSWGRGFVRFKDNQFQRFDASNSALIGIPGANDFLVINDIEEDANGNAWILNYWAADKKPISVLKNDGTIISYELASPLASTIISVKELVIDQYNTKWFSGDISGDAATEGLFYFNDGGTLENLTDDTWGKLTESSGLRNKDIRDLAIDKFGEIIIGTSSGVDIIPDPSSPTSIRNDQYFAIRSEIINAVAVDAINQKWFGTENGIFLMSSDGSILIANFTKENSSLPSDNINDIAIDENNGIIYVGTDFGLTTINTMFIKPNENFSEITAYPNPVEISNKDNNNLIINGLIEDSEIKILNIAGNVIQEFSSIGGKTTFWDCKDKNGNLVPSGVYIIVAYDMEINQVGHTKVAVLRK